jgi:hypothetical protein
MNQEKTYTTLELLCVFFWFLLDGFWLLEWKATAYGFSVLSVAAAIGMFCFIKRDRAMILVACADTCWLLCNITWAVGDLSHIKPALTAAKWMFGVGFLLCCTAFAVTEHGQRLKTLVLSRLRIMKFFERQ